MAALFLGFSVGAFMSAFINTKFNTLQWINSRYLLWLGGLLLAVSGVLFWMEA